MGYNIKETIKKALKPLNQKWIIIVEGEFADSYNLPKGYKVEFMDDKGFEKEGLATALMCYYLKDEHLCDYEWVDRIMLDMIPCLNSNWIDTITDVTVLHGGDYLDLSTIDPDTANDIIRSYLTDTLEIAYYDAIEIANSLYESGYLLTQRKRDYSEDEE